jgi:hypothetical protein
VKALLHERPQIKSVVLFGIEVSSSSTGWLIGQIAPFSHMSASCNLLWILSRQDTMST